MRKIKMLSSVLMILLLVALTGMAGFAMPPQHVGPVRDTREVRMFWIRQAITWIHTQQEDDGSFGHSAGLTADTIFILGLAEEDPGSAVWTRNGHSALDALRQFTPAVVSSGRAGNIAKVLRAAAMAHQDVHHFAGYDLVQALMNTYNPATARFDETNNFAQLIALQALAVAGQSPPTNAVLSLINDQRPDGGWGWQYRGTSSDVDTTGLTLLTLWSLGLPVTIPQIAKALSYLQTMQQPDGGWGMNQTYPQSNCNSTALAIAGIAASLRNPRIPPWTGRNPDGTWRDPLMRLLRFQEADGGFRWRDDAEGTRLLATRDAVIALYMPWRGDSILSHQHVLPLVALGQ